MSEIIRSREIGPRRRRIRSGRLPASLHRHRIVVKQSDFDAALNVVKPLVVDDGEETRHD